MIIASPLCASRVQRMYHFVHPRLLLRYFYSTSLFNSLRGFWRVPVLEVLETITGPAILHSGGSGGADLAVEAIFSSLRRRPSSPPDCYVTLFHLQGQESHIMRCKFKL